VGEIVELLADDPAAVADVAAYARMRGHTLLSSADGVFRVRKEPPATARTAAGAG
jgi:TusA-related sulfurtransferase